MSDDELDGSALRLGGLAALGIGVTLGEGGLGTRLSVVSTQAMTGHEPAPALIAMIAVWWGISFGGAASVELPLCRRAGQPSFTRRSEGACSRSAPQAPAAGCSSRSSFSPRTPRPPASGYGRQSRSRYSFPVLPEAPPSRGQSTRGGLSPEVERSLDLSAHSSGYRHRPSIQNHP